MGLKPSPFLIDVGKRIQAVRLQRRYSQADLAQKAKLHQVTISLIENGRRAITLTTLERLAKALQTTPRDLVPPLREE